MESIDEIYDTKLLNVEQALERLQIGRSTLYRLINRKQLVAVKNGRRTLFRPSDISNFIKGLNEYGENYYG